MANCAAEQCSSDTGPSDRDMKSLERIPAWEGFIENLANTGFFQGEKIDSVKHKGLMGQAAEAFRKTEEYKQHRARAEAPADRILELLKKEFAPSKVSRAAFSPQCSMHSAE